MAYFETRLQIDWSEVDYMGHVNSLAILRYAQTSRVLCCERAGLMPYQTEDGSGPILASVDCRYLVPLYYPGSITVCTGVEKVGNTSIVLSHRIFDEKGRLAAQARDVLVYFDYASGGKKPVPEAARQCLMQFSPDTEERRNDWDEAEEKGR